jgi:hypothetical protein
MSWLAFLLGRVYTQSLVALIFLEDLLLPQDFELD